MTLHTNDRISGFIVRRTRCPEELGGTLVEMKHEKTGAELIWLDNGAENKLFSIIFKTLPEDSTGVFHIIEHSVLCGSEKYPVKEPFVDLLKSSMKTYLNASTAPDCTRYPVSSRNNRDYLNLMRVYLDAVFSPRFLEEPNIFYQEGWHIEQNDGELSYKGVVYNEMKGAMSNVSVLIGRKLLSMLFPDNCYGFNSGGAPEAIPDLSYENFVKTYRRFYHPSNARVYLDGSVPLAETLEALDEYFSRYEQRSDFPEITLQVPRACEETLYYELSQGEDAKNKGRFALARIIGDWRQGLKSAAAYVLKDALAGSNEAPLKKSILDSGLAKNMNIAVSDSYAQHYIRILFEDVKDGAEEELRLLLRETLLDIRNAGIDRDALHASINRLEFMLREPDEPAGLIRMSTALCTWLYGGDPMQPMCVARDMEALRLMADSGEFEGLLEELLLDESGLAVLRVLPSATVGEEQRRGEKDRLESIRATWKEADFNRNCALNERLRAWQQTEDTPQQRACLPKLPLSEVDAEPVFTDSKEICIDGVTMLQHRVSSRGIVYINAYFALGDLRLEELTKLSLLPSLLGRLPTKRHDALALQQLLKRYTGSFETTIECTGKRNEPKLCAPRLRVSFSALERDLETALKLAAEIMTQTEYDSPEKILNILLQTELNCRQMGAMAGHALGVVSVLAHYSAADAVTEAISGYTRVKWIQAFSTDFDGRIKGYIDFLRRVSSASFCKRRLLLSQTCAKEQSLDALINALPEGEEAPEWSEYVTGLSNSFALRIPARSSFSTQGDHLSRMGVAYDAGFNVGEQIATLDHLWNAVRVQGGAYGTKLSVSFSGAIYSYSYRDPAPMASIEENRRAADYLEKFCDRGGEIDPYIISTVAKIEPLESPQEKGLSADSDYFMNISRDDYRRMRREMLETDYEKLRRFAKVLRRFADEGKKCVVGHEEALKACTGMQILDL